MQSLVWCNHLTHLDLGRNSLAKAGIHLAKSIRTWGNNPPLQQRHLYDCLLGKAGKNLANFIKIHQIQVLLLENCEMSADTSTKLLQALSSCKKLISLDLSGNIHGEGGIIWYNPSNLGEMSHHSRDYI